MECNEIRGLLYEFITERLDRENSRMVQEHLKMCRECQADYDELKETLSLLNEWKAPEPLPHLKEKVMEDVEARVKESSVSGFRRIMEKLFKPYYIKIPLEGLAAVVIVLLTLIIYRGFSPEVKVLPKKLEITKGVVEAKNPIVIGTEDVEEAFNQLIEIVKAYNGRLIRRRVLDSGKELTFNIDERKEEALFHALKQLGKVSIAKEGYRDGEGNIVVMVRRMPSGR